MQMVMFSISAPEARRLCDCCVILCPILPAQPSLGYGSQKSNTLFESRHLGTTDACAFGGTTAILDRQKHLKQAAAGSALMDAQVENQNSKTQRIKYEWSGLSFPNLRLDE